MAGTALKPDVELLFGVLGGGKISGESGALIKSQLDSIVKSLNSKTEAANRNVIFTLNTQGTQAEIVGGLRKIADSVSRKSQISLKVSKLDADSAIAKLKSDLNAMLRTLKVDTGFDVTIGTNGATSAVKQITADANAAYEALTRVDASIKEINLRNKSIDSAYKKVTGGLGTGENSAEELQALDALRNKYVELQSAVDTLKLNKQQATQSEINDIYRLQSEMNELINTTRLQTEERRRAAAEAVKNSKNVKTAKEQEIEAAKEHQKLITQVNTLQKNAQTALNYTAASHTEQYKAIKLARDELDLMSKDYSRLDAARLTKLNNIIKDNTTEIRAMGKATRSWGDIFTSNITKFTSWFGISQTVMYAVNSLYRMVDAVREVDAAMTELRKVTNETESTYNRFLDNAAARARELGATLSDTINATAEFARLGYSIDEASELADAAIVYKNVGDGIESISEAAQSIISTMQAFGIAAEDAMLIVDKFNEVGNNFAISSKGVGEALLRSASALQAGGNTIDESIALITAANTVIQDPEKVGKVMPNGTVMCRKQIAISVKSQRWSRPRKDHIPLYMESVTTVMLPVVTRWLRYPPTQYGRVKIQSELAL